MDNYTSPKEREYQNEIVKLFREELHYNYLGKLQYGKNRLRGEKRCVSKFGRSENI